MVQICSGNLFQSKAQTRVNAVNCVGVMGKGIALEFKKRFPDMFRDYELRCRAGEVCLGQPYLFRQLLGPWILNFPTKDHWREGTRLADLIAGLEWLVQHYKAWGISSLAVPALGCGNGGLDWCKVRPVLESHLGQLDIPVEIYAPSAVSDNHPRVVSQSESLPEIADKPNPVAIALLARDVDRVYHMTDARNVPSILGHGLLSYNEMRRSSLPRADISNPEVQRLRDKRKVFGVTDLHDFVPFYFAWFTQMQRVIERRDEASRDALVFLEIDVLQLAILRRSIVFSVENAAKRVVEPTNDPRHLDLINWTAVAQAKATEKTPYWSVAPSAELLVSSRVPPNAIHQIVCRTSNTAENLIREMAEVSQNSIPVAVEPRRYFS
ncbi:MAG: DarT ssDNA thymidine ADP-ribosyltransferase family protein [Verrucomicrobia bacterium]|nr:DarT ssDNA thymidine ADP-ribosyltransferase family protein [Verrucomicrobiota bacterium]